MISMVCVILENPIEADFLTRLPETGQCVQRDTNVNQVQALKQDKVSKDAVTSQQEGHLFLSHMRSFYVEFACPPCVCLGSLQALQLSPPQSTDMHVRMIGNSKLATGVSANGCLSLRDKLSCVLHRFHPETAEAPAPPPPPLSYLECRVNRVMEKMDGWDIKMTNCMKYSMYTL